jgi:hypothetical protein
MLLPGENTFRAAEEKKAAEKVPAKAATPDQDSPPIPPDQLDALVAPIALYPDALLAQTLVAATNPL